LSDAIEPAPPPLRRARSPEARQAARLKKAERESRIIFLLNGGASIAEIAAREGVNERGMRKYVRALLARRAPAPPAEFMALQVSRLNEALLVAYSAMSGENLEAVDRVVTIVRELDRYHGFGMREEDAKPRRPRRAPPPLSPLALAAPPPHPERKGTATP